MKMQSTLSTAGLLATVMLMALCSGGNAYTRYFTVYQSGGPVKPEVCKYKGYIPGGGVKGVEPIASPVAKGFESALGSVAGVIAKTAGAGRAGGAALAAIASSIAKVAKVASKLSAGFGVFAAAFSIVESFTKPTPQDILDKVNVAFAEMTKDVNNRLKAMEGYADGRVIELEQNLIKNQFATLKRYFTSCIRETTDPEVRTCQRLANKKIYAELPNFQKLGDQFLAKAKAKDISFYDIKRLEATLIAFRDYAGLHLFSLQLLVNSYREDPDSQENTDKLKLYLGDLKKFGKEYYDYAYWAYNLIHQRQIDENLARTDYSKAGEAKDLWEGWFVKVHTLRYQTFTTKCSLGDEPAEINKCEIRKNARADGKKPPQIVGYKAYPLTCSTSSPSYTNLTPDAGCQKKALLILASKKATEICTSYLNSLKKDLESFWKLELLEVADVWKQVGEKAEDAPELA